jgi:hypothetical protein
LLELFSQTTVSIGQLAFAAASLANPPEDAVLVTLFVAAGVAVAVADVLPAAAGAGVAVADVSAVFLAFLPFLVSGAAGVVVIGAIVEEADGAVLVCARAPGAATQKLAAITKAGKIRNAARSMIMINFHFQVIAPPVGRFHTPRKPAKVAVKPPNP